jgi:hypothetical protein
VIDRACRVACCHRDIARQHGRAHIGGIDLARELEFIRRSASVLALQRFLRALAIKLGNFLPIGLTARFFELLSHGDGLLPVLLDFIDREQASLGFDPVRAAIKSLEGVFGAIEQPGLQKILTQFKQGVFAFYLGQIIAIQQILMHADRTFGFPATAKQIPEREMEFGGLGIQLDDFDKRIDRLIRLLVEQEIQAAEVRARQVGAFG